MAVKRNDPCPCGSGRKYKKCCLKKKDVVQLNEYKEERFYQQKHLLVKKINDFFDETIPLNEYYQLQAQFRIRTERKIPRDMEEGFMRYWLYFFHRFENGLRGIEWFYKVNKNRFSEEERVMAERWIGLSPRLVQAVNKSSSGILFEDIYTQKQFPSSDSKENMPHFKPWCGTYSLIEPFENKYYFNGVRILGNPKQLQQAAEKADELAKHYNLNPEQVLRDYYPEILAAFSVSNTEEEEEEEELNEIHQYIIEYDVNNNTAVSEFLQKQGKITVDKWNNDVKIFNWVDNWKSYSDNEMHGEVRLGDLFGTLHLEKDRLIVTCYDGQHGDELKRKLNAIGNVISLVNEDVETTKTSVQIKNMFVNLTEDTPKYFALYAQNCIAMDVDYPIPKFGNLSIRELVENGKVVEAETWLKQMEYNMYNIVESKHGEVEITADFNTVRIELDLPLSPFVTGGEKRKSYIKSIGSERIASQTVPENDIPYLEDLGFMPDTIDNFYTAALVRFFKEKTNGKSESTVRKYRSSLYDLREALEFRRLSSWEQCDLLFWKRLLTKDFFEINVVVSKTQLKDFLSTLKTFAKWLDRSENTSIYNQVIKTIDETKDELSSMIGSPEKVNIIT